MAANLVKSNDSQWLQVDVCREFQRNVCPWTSEDSCKFAHPSQNTEVINNKVMACYDSLKGRCRRDVCKYYHPSLNLVETLLQKGRHHLAVKNSFAQPAPVMMQPMFIPIPSEMPAMMMPTVPAELASVIVKPEAGTKRHSDALSDSLYQSMFSKRQAIERLSFPFMQSLPYQPIYQFPTPAEPTSVIPLNASFVNYTDERGQLLDNLPVCQDFNRNLCTRVNCKFVHLLDPKKLEINEQRVAICRDDANGICRRQQCKYYHIPIQLPPATDLGA